MKIWSFIAAMLAVQGVHADSTQLTAQQKATKAAHEKFLQGVDSAQFSSELLKSGSLPSLYEATHSSYLLGNASQMLAFDIDRDGVQELVAAGSFQGDNRTAYSVLKANTNGSYRIERQSDEIASTGTILLTYHLAQGAEPVALIAMNNSLKLLNLESLEFMAMEADANFYSPQQAILNDINNDGIIELLIRDSWRVYVLDPTSLAVKSTYNTSSSSIISIANTDSSPDIETVTVDSRYVDNEYRYFLTISAITGSGLVQKREIPISGYSSNPQLYDLNQDGISEIFLYNYSEGLKVLNAETGAELWHDLSYQSQSIRPLASVDINNDDVQEFITVNANDGRSIDFRDASTGQSIRTVRVTEGSLVQLLPFSADEAMVLSGNGYYSSPQSLARVSLADGNVLWRSDETGSATNYVGLAAQAEQQPALLVSVHSGDDYSNSIHIRVRQQSDLVSVSKLDIVAGSGDPSQYRAATTADTDGDGNDELIVVATRGYNQVIYVINLQTRAFRWFVIGTNHYARYGVAAVDTDNNGKDELVVASHTKLLLIDANHGAILQEVLSTNQYASDATEVLVGDMDGDAVLDVLVGGGVYGSTVVSQYRLATTPTFVKGIAAPSYRSLALLDSRAEGKLALLIGTDQGKLLRYEATQAEWLTVAAPCSGALMALKALTAEQMLMICGRQAAIYDAQLQAARWVDADLPTYLLNSNGIAFDNAPVNKTLFLAGGRINRVSYLGHVRRPTAHPMVLRTHWRTALTSSLLVTNPNPELTLTAKLLVEPAAGAVTLPSDGTLLFQYTPSGSALTTDQFRYSISNGHLESDSALVVVERSNTAPVSFGSSVTVKAGQSVSGNINARDADADPMQWQTKTSPNLGTVTINADTGTFNYTANGNASGEDSFIVTISDGVSTSDAEVKVTITKKSSSGGGSVTLLLPMLLVMAAACRRYRGVRQKRS